MLHELIEVIKRLSISIAIFSKTYASSKKCLRELVQMWECRELYGQIIILIFYDVSRMDVKHQAGEFERSFNLHEIDGVNSKTIETWRKVLRQIGGLPGYESEKIHGRVELLKRVIKHVLRVLKNHDQAVTDKLVGIDHRVQEMMGMIGVADSKGQVVEVQGEEVCVVRIWGLPGVGKTTLAKVVFNEMRKLFDASSFLEDISLEGVPFSQRLLIADLRKQKPALLNSIHEGIEEIAYLCHDAKVLIVLDNVDDAEQIKALAGSLSWFGPESRIIVTTDKEYVLDAFDVGAVDGHTVEKYELESMRGDHALELFRKHAIEGEAFERVSNVIPCPQTL